jgi:hypothetical protein
MDVWLFAVSAVASAIGGMLGMAGGIFVVPALALFGGIPLRTAIGASLISVIACSCASAGPFLRARLTNMRLAIVLEAATTSGAVTGVVLAGRIPAAWLYALFAAVLVASAWQMVVRRGASGAVAGEGAPTRWASLGAVYREDGRDLAYRVERLPLGMSLMYGAGLLSALLGIGSGVLKIPAMDAALRLPLKVSSATSNFMIGVTAAASAGAFLVRGEIVPAIAAPVALGAVLGALVGARVLLAVSSDRLRMAFAGVLVLLAVQMVLAALGVQLVHGGG